MLAIALSSGFLVGIVGSVAAIASAAAGYATHRLNRARLGPEIRDLAASTEQRIANAATDAVAVIERALQSAKAQLTDMQTKLDEVQSELQETRAELTAALVDRDERDRIIADLRAHIADLEARIEELEARLGGRRGSDPPGPALTARP